MLLVSFEEMSKTRLQNRFKMLIVSFGAESTLLFHKKVRTKYIKEIRSESNGQRPVASTSG
jgi:hypothetical protein